MTLSLAVYAEAVDELDNAISWYDQGGQGRGQKFRVSFNEVLDRCLDWPESAQVDPLERDDVVVRTAVVLRSNYRIVYFVDHERLNVVAVAHGRRRPGYWRDRIPVGPAPGRPPSDPGR